MSSLREPGSYSAIWTLADEKLNGTINLSAGQRPTGVMRGAEGAGLGSYPKPAVPVDVLRGRLDNDYDVVLVDAQLRHVFLKRTQVSAALALVGWNVPDDLRFGRVEFQVGGLTELATVRPLREVRMPVPLSSGEQFSAHWNLDSTQRWRSAGGDEIELRFNVNFKYHDHYGLSVTTSPIVRVWGTPRTAEDWLRDYVVPLAELTTLATARRQRVAWVKLGVEPEHNPSAPIQAFGANIEDQAAFDSMEQDPRVDLRAASLIPLGPDGVDLAAVLDQWRDLRAKYRTFHDYLVMPRTAPDAGGRAQVLAAVPALEALHDQLRGRPGPGPEAQRCDEVLDRIRTTHAGGKSLLTEEDLQFLAGKLAPDSRYELAPRLATLVRDYVSPELRALVTGLVDPLPPVLALDEMSQKQTVWEAMATVRNRLGHGNRLVPTDEQIDAVICLAHTLAAAVALHLLDVPDTVLCNGIRDQWWRAV
jgi:hypothetical protein